MVKPNLGWEGVIDTAWQIILEYKKANAFCLLFMWIMINSVQIGSLPRQEKDLHSNRSRWLARKMNKGHLSEKWTNDLLTARSPGV
jgi:hypothetical protein